MYFLIHSSILKLVIFVGSVYSPILLDEKTEVLEFDWITSTAELNVI